MSVVTLYEDSEGSTLEWGNCENGDPLSTDERPVRISFVSFVLKQRRRSTTSHTLIPLEASEIDGIFSLLHRSYEFHNKNGTNGLKLPIYIKSIDELIPPLGYSTQYDHTLGFHPQTQKLESPCTA